MAFRVSFCFFCNVHLWYQIPRTLLKQFQSYCLFNILPFFSCKSYDVITDLICILQKCLSLKRKKIFRKEKSHSSVFQKAFQISRKYFSRHIHFKCTVFTGISQTSPLPFLLTLLLLNQYSQVSISDFPVKTSRFVNVQLTKILGQKREKREASALSN